MRNLTTMAALVLAVGSARDVAALDLTVNPDVVAGREAFLAASPAADELAWSSFFAPNAHAHTSLFPVSVSASYPFALADGTSVRVSAATGQPDLALANWVDGPGFDAQDGSAAADLAVSGTEDFDFSSVGDVYAVGFTAVSGDGNAQTPEFDLAGATFDLTPLDEAGNPLGTVQFSLAAGGRSEAFVEVFSFRPFRKLLVREVGGTGKDQYFGNLLLTRTVPPLVVSVDVQPGSSMNKVVISGKNPKDAEVAILSSATFDALTVDPLTVQAGDKETGVKTSPVSWYTQDVNRDGMSDVVFVFTVFDLTSSGALGPMTTVVELTGATFEGQRVVGSDRVEVVVRGPK